MLENSTPFSYLVASQFILSPDNLSHCLNHFKNIRHIFYYNIISHSSRPEMPNLRYTWDNHQSILIICNDLSSAWVKRSIRSLAVIYRILYTLNDLRKWLLVILVNASVLHYDNIRSPDVLLEFLRNLPYLPTVRRRDAQVFLDFVLSWCVSGLHTLQYTAQIRS